MTQEELDALISQGDIENIKDIDETKKDTTDSATPTDDPLQAQMVDPANYRADATKSWPPPPPTTDHKVVSQLDDVTKDSEVKATELLDQLDVVNNYIGKIEKEAKKLEEFVKTSEDMMNKLSQRFPQIDSFKSQLESIKSAKESLKSIKNLAMDSSDANMQAMDMMQYQDIHRQKIERVINVMRALAQYMNSLFEGKIDDSKRVSSAVFIEGDENSDATSDDELEALIASFGKK